MHEVTTECYSPRSAWRRALIYFSCCFAIAGTTGVLRQLAGTAPTLRLGSSVVETLVGIAVVAQLLFAYGYLWPRGTTHHNRPRRWLLQAGFGLLWGTAQAVLMLSMFSLLEALLANRLTTAAATFFLTATLTGFWHGRYWDIRVAPDHNVREWNLRKVLLAHAPFLILTLLHYALTANVYVFVGAHALALMASSLVMRFPAPWDPPTPQHQGEGRSAAELCERGLLGPRL